MSKQPNQHDQPDQTDKPKLDTLSSTAAIPAILTIPAMPTMSAVAAVAAMPSMLTDSTTDSTANWSDYIGNYVAVVINRENNQDSSTSDELTSLSGLEQPPECPDHFLLYILNISSINYAHIRECIDNFLAYMDAESSYSNNDFSWNCTPPPINSAFGSAFDTIKGTFRINLYTNTKDSNPFTIIEFQRDNLSGWYFNEIFNAAELYFQNIKLIPNNTNIDDLIRSLEIWPAKSLYKCGAVAAALNKMLAPESANVDAVLIAVRFHEAGGLKMLADIIQQSNNIKILRECAELVYHIVNYLASDVIPDIREMSLAIRKLSDQTDPDIQKYMMIINMFINM